MVGGKQLPAGQWLLLAAGAMLACGCGQSRLPTEALVLTQTPVTTRPDTTARTVLDDRYPPGSRVVLLPSPTRPGDVRVLSRGLAAAGGPVISPGSARVYFAGKSNPTDAWQIYEARPSGGYPRRLTTLPGGAMDPAVLGNGELVFSSPVPTAGQTWTANEPAALHVLDHDGTVRRLTFGVSAAVEPTVLNDGRILFVSAKPATGTNAEPSLGLYTVNNDGTEVAAYALNRDGTPWVNRPRELQNGWVGLIAAGGAEESFAEGVRTARPFNSRKRLFGFDVARCRSVESGLNGAVLACLQTPEPEAAAKDRSLAVFEIKAGDNILTPPLFDDPAWHDIEAMRPGTRPAPLGHISAMSPAKGFGTILCLNANYSRERQDDGKPLRTASRVRVTTPDADGGTKALGDVPLRPDGSFMAEVPADRPLGFESLDESGRVIHRLPPYLWVRAGENRTCIGCHEPSNRSPRNLRPLAVNQPIVKLSLTTDPVAQAAH